MTVRGRSGLQWISPALPLRTGIANYAQDVFRAVDGRWPMTVFLEPGSQLERYRSIHDGGRSDPDPDVPSLIHIGNSEFHERAFDLGRRMESVLVLHDVVLHHALAAYALRKGRSREYWRDLERLYGQSGTEAGRALLGGRQVERLEDFPLSERFVERAIATIVHSAYAADDVKRFVPDAEVRVVRMGIPIPAVVSREIARKALGLPSSAFIVASISHVNPNKRIPVVLRALRRLAVRTKDVLFVIAGTGSDSDALDREIRILGLDGHVLPLGYVDDRTARLLASAADACVNLRYPTTGETSASLLRLLGAGLPVLVSDAGTSAELPEGVGLKIPVDNHEVELISEVLWRLAIDKKLRDDAGEAARQYVIANHSMQHEIDGFRRVIQEFYGVELPGLDHVPVEKQPEIPDLESTARSAWSPASRVAAAIGDLGLASQQSIVTSAAEAIVELGLDASRPALEAKPTGRLFERLRCRDCGGKLNRDGECLDCGRTIPLEGQIPDLR